MLLAILAMYIVSRYDYRRLLRLSAVILLSSLVLQVVVLIIRKRPAMGQQDG